MDYSDPLEPFERRTVSSFLVTHKTLNLAAANVVDWIDDTDAVDAVRELAELNLDGYLGRYNDAEAGNEAFAWFANLGNAPLVGPSGDIRQAFTSLQCILYQASEGDVPESETFKKYEQGMMRMAVDIATKTCQATSCSWDAS